jgi:uncharacterized protein (TIGR03382 family)
MKNVIIAAVAGFAGLATANPFFHNGGVADMSNAVVSAPRGNTVSIDLAGIQNWDAAGSSFNETLSVLIGANATVTGIGWDNVVIEALGGSWISEARILFADSPIGLGLAPGVADAFPGTGGPYSSGGILDLASADPSFPFQVGANGLLNIEFTESFDDVPGAVDSIYLSGTLTVQYVPTPGALAVLGLGGLVATRRRR